MDYINTHVFLRTTRHRGGLYLKNDVLKTRFMVSCHGVLYDYASTYIICRVSCLRIFCYFSCKWRSGVFRTHHKKVNEVFYAGVMLLFMPPLKLWLRSIYYCSKLEVCNQFLQQNVSLFLNLEKLFDVHCSNRGDLWHVTHFTPFFSSSIVQHNLN